MALVLAIFTFSCSNESMDSGENSCSFTNSQEENVYSIKHKNGILFLKIGNLDVNTHASVFSRYKIRQISQGYVFLRSSDIGEYVITNKISKEWNTYLTKNIKVNGYDIFIISLKPYGLGDPERNSNGIRVLFVKGECIKVFNLDGKFHFKFSRIDIKGNSISIETESNNYTFYISDTISLE